MPVDPEYPFDVFLAHNQAQKDWTRKLAVRLDEEGFNVWFDEWCIRGSQDFIDAMVEGIVASRKVVPILSPEFLDADWTRFELKQAILGDPAARDARIIPIRHSDCTIPKEIQNRNALDFRDTHGDELKLEYRTQILLADLNPARDRPKGYEQWVQAQEQIPAGGLPPPRPLPIGSRMPHRRNKGFVGREEDLKELYTRLQASAAVGIGQVVAAAGLGGIGKSQLAVEFAYRYGRRYPGGVFWLDMADADNVANEVARCAGPGGLDLPLADEAKAEQLVEAMRQHWEANLSLVIFDNVDDLAVASEWLKMTGRARVLITSRIASADDTWRRAGVDALPLDTLPRAQSMELLCAGRPEALGDNAEWDAADEVCELLGDLPLALHLASCYLADMKYAISYAEYLQKLRDQPALEDDALVDYVQDPSPTGHVQSVAATFQTSYDRLDADDATDADAMCLLHVCGFFAPVSINRDLAARALDWVEEDKIDTPRFAEAANRLGRLGMRSQDPGNGRLSLHRLVREFARGHPGPGQASERTFTEVAEVVGDFARDVNSRGLPAPIRPEIEHLRHLAEEAGRAGVPAAGSLFNELGFHLKVDGDFPSARIACERALAIDEATLGSEHLEVARDANNLGSVLNAQGDLAGARAHYERALAIAEAAYGPDHPGVAHYLNNLAGVLSAEGDQAGARAHFERALAIDEVVYGPDHPTVAVRLNNLGGLSQDLGDSAGARAYYERALLIDEAALGLEHPNVAIRLNNLGSVLQDMGDLAAAREHFERALVIDEAAYGPDHPMVAIRLNNLGNVLRSQGGDLAAARAHIERALAINEVVYGLEHPAVAKDANNLGNVLRAQGDLAGARVHCERALAIAESTLGAAHPDTQIVRENLKLLDG